jgi:hypothetical protein
MQQAGWKPSAPGNAVLLGNDGAPTSPLAWVLEDIKGTTSRRDF